MEDKISIILPIFNVGPHLRGGIDSLINQTIGNENLEIIMVDDCSTDESGKIIDEYDEKYDCCKAIHLEKNTGAANGPRNRGIEECSGDYIMFLDPDDRYTLDACEVLYNAVTMQIWLLEDSEESILMVKLFKNHIPLIWMI